MSMTVVSGRWICDRSRRAQKLVRKRVTITGTRAGFDLIDVQRMVAMGEEPPTWRRLISRWHA